MSNITNLRAKGPRPAKPRPIPDGAVSVRIPQMCEMLGIGQTKGYELVRTGRVESVLIGKTRLVSVRSIRALFNDQAA